MVEGTTGFRVDGKQLQPLVNALAEVLGNPALAERMGLAGHARAHSEFSWDSVAQKTLSLLASGKQLS